MNWHPLMQFKAARLKAVPCMMLLALCFLIGCRTSLPFRNEQFLLSSEEIRDSVYASRAGDAQAAYKLFLHYSLGLGYTEMGDVWKKRAAELGYDPKPELPPGWQQ